MREGEVYVELSFPRSADGSLQRLLDRQYRRFRLLSSAERPGVAQHNSDAKWQRILKGRVDGFLKKLAQDVSMRAAIVGGEIVLHLQGTGSAPQPDAGLPNNVAGSSAASASSLAPTSSAGSEAAMTAMCMNVVVHVALHYKSPWRSTLVMLDRVGGAAFPLLHDQHAVSTADCLHLRAVKRCTGEMAVNNMERLIAQLDPGLSWSLPLWKLSEASSPCLPLDGRVYARPGISSMCNAWRGRQVSKS